MRDIVDILRGEIEIVNSRLTGAIAVANEKMAAIKETAAVLLPELMRRLEELNNAAARRQSQEAVDRQQYVQASAYQTWKNDIDKQLSQINATLDRSAGEKQAGAWVRVVATGLLVGVIMFLVQKFAH